MLPLRVEIDGVRCVDHETFEIGETRIENIAGRDDIRILRDPNDEDGASKENETYYIDHVDHYDPGTPQNLERIIIDARQKSGHFYVGSVEVWAEYMEES